MSLTTEVVDDISRLEALREPWQALARSGGDGALFRGPTWTLAWTHAFGAALEATLRVIVVRDDERLVGLAPFYERTARMAGMKTREVRLLGDAGPRPPALDLLVASGYEERFALAVAQHLNNDRAWDILDLAPLRDPSRARAYLAEKLDGSGRKAEAQEAGTTLAVALAWEGSADDSLPPPDPRVTVWSAEDVDKGLTTLRRLARLEWAVRDEACPFADGESMALLRQLGARARLSRLDGEHGEAIAAAVVVDDPPRAVCVALAVDPEERGGWRLLSSEAHAARARGLRALDVVAGAGDVEPPPLPITHRRSLRLRAFNNTTAGALARTYASIRRRAEAAREAPGAAAAGARAAWTKIREAAATVASYERLHLYRGQLWTRGVQSPEGLTLDELGEREFDALSPTDRTLLLERLELDETYCREKWRRGDLVVLARLNARPVGIAWCARSAVQVAEIGREVRPGPSECYIHDVFVAADARGKNVAPAMLEDLAKRLRQRDVYRAWALIEPSNVASTRAFEKAAFTPVCDVIHARMAVMDKIVIRPPDPEARRLLGVS